MFINTGKFKKMLKTAYDSCGLLMSREEDVILLVGGSFLIRTYMSRMTKKEKAAIIELVGDFPDNHETFRANKGGEQQELRMPEIWGFHNQFDQANENYKETYVIVDVGTGYVRALQNTTDNSVFWLDESLVGAISLAALQELEDPPQGPRIIDKMAMWRNEWTTYAILKFDLKNDEFSKLLENMELYTCQGKK